MYWNILSISLLALKANFNLYMRCIETNESNKFETEKIDFNLYMRCIETGL